jgi:hypothetical protein
LLLLLLLLLLLSKLLLLCRLPLLGVMAAVPRFPPC